MTVHHFNLFDGTDGQTLLPAPNTTQHTPTLNPKHTLVSTASPQPHLPQPRPDTPTLHSLSRR